MNLVIISPVKIIVRWNSCSPDYLDRGLDWYHVVLVVVTNLLEEILTLKIGAICYQSFERTYCLYLQDIVLQFWRWQQCIPSRRW